MKKTGVHLRLSAVSHFYWPSYPDYDDRTLQAGRRCALKCVAGLCPQDGQRPQDDQADQVMEG